MKAPNIVSEYLVSIFYVLPKNHGNNNVGNWLGYSQRADVLILMGHKSM